MTSKSVVITGSTRGIGLGLAEEFLSRGCQVAINSRSQERVDRALKQLRGDYESDKITGVSGDVVDIETHQALWAQAVSAFDRVDIWINNAGIGHPTEMIWDLAEETIQQVIDINIKGLVFGSQVAVRGMLAQGYGHIYNMEGFGSNGRKQVGMGVYGTTKAAVHYFSDALKAETSRTNVKVSTLSPGMVITDLILERYEEDPQAFEQAKTIFNTIADKVETVTPWLVDRMLHNDKSGAKIKWLTPTKLFFRFATAPFRKRDVFS